MRGKSKYEPIRQYLERSGAQVVPMSFEEIERILDFKLPGSKAVPAWWSNNPTNNVMTKEWLAAGYKTAQVDVKRRKLVFVRTTPKSTDGTAGRRPRPHGAAKQPRRHPLFGSMKGTLMIAPGTDLTQPADPEWGKVSDLGRER